MYRLVQVLHIIALNCVVAACVWAAGQTGDTRNSEEQVGRFCLTEAGREWCETGCCGTTRHSGNAVASNGSGDDQQHCCLRETPPGVIVGRVVAALCILGTVAFFCWCCWYLKVAGHRRSRSMPHTYLSPGSTANPLTNNQSNRFGDGYKNASGRSIPAAPAAPYRPLDSNTAARPVYPPHIHPPRQFIFQNKISG